MMARKLTGFILLSLMLAMASSISLAADSAEAQKSIDIAVAAQKKAASVEGEWRDTGKIIKKAKLAQKKGDFDEAVKLANKAARQGKHGYEQATAQATLRLPSYFK